ncbi:MAG: hypothetical protein IJV41_01015 [Oscillospiraceae bacterium]|nr:hypothetical protein [Oscillospiraceae bacterium]
MIDFHSHILPEIDDGSDSIETSLAMLRESRRQGVDLICATSHFYADEDDPASYLARRNHAYARLRAAMGDSKEYPEIRLGAEILYFPGISVAEEMRGLILERTPFLLVEPPMMPWSEEMLDEVELCGETLSCIPVIAHIDRYMRLLNDYTLFDRVKDRRLLIQVNASFFVHHDTRDFALECLREGRIHFMGSDCHNMGSRRPNMGHAAQVIRHAGEARIFSDFQERVYRVFGN